jgi:hypothetical protein
MKIHTMKSIAAGEWASMADRLPGFFHANIVAAAALTACFLLPLDVTCAVAAVKTDAKSHAMTPEVKLVDDYNAWFFGEVTAGDVEKLKAGLPKYITSDTVLHEALSLPWGGTMVGYDGWVRLSQITGPIFGKILSFVEVSAPKYYQHGNVVVREISLTIKPTKAAPEPFVMGIIEKFTVENGRISQIDEFYADTASFLERLSVLGALPEHGKKTTAISFTDAQQTIGSMGERS